jgi:hypothetical protein
MPCNPESCPYKIISDAKDLGINTRALEKAVEKKNKGTPAPESPQEREWREYEENHLNRPK